MTELIHFLGWLILLIHGVPFQPNTGCFRMIIMSAVILSYMNWPLDIILSRSRSWRIWEFQSGRVDMLYIGLWDAFYVDKVNSSVFVINLVVQKYLNGSNWTVPNEIWYGQDLMSMALFLNVVVMIYATLSLYIVWKKKPYTTFLCSCCRICICSLFLSCACTAFATSWNFIMDFYYNTELDFPENFVVMKSSLIKKHFTYVFPMGLISSSLSIVNATLFISQMWLMRPRKYRQGRRDSMEVRHSPWMQKDGGSNSSIPYGPLSLPGAISEHRARSST